MASPGANVGSVLAGVWEEVDALVLVVVLLDFVEVLEELDLELPPPTVTLTRTVLSHEP